MNPDNKNKIVFDKQSTSPENTQEYGRSFAALLKQGDIVCFTGNLGSGKTTFIKGLCVGLEVNDNVTSPTFTLINEYKGKLPIYHFDFYRIPQTEELDELGLYEYLYGDGICLLEWPEIILNSINSSYYMVTMQHCFDSGNETTRQVTITFNGIQ